MNWLNRNSNAILGVLLSFAWIALFAAGMLIDSSHARNNLTSIQNWITVLFTYTPTNIAFLSIACATVGGITSNVNSKNYLNNLEVNGIRFRNLDPESKEFKRLAYMNESPFSAMIRGLLAYLLLITGSFIVTDSPFDITSQSQYVRLAGTISILAYTLGYDPTRLQDILDKVDTKTKGLK